MAKKSVLILGGGTMQLPAIRSSLSRGWNVAVADGNPNAPGALLAHRFLPVDLRDVKGMIESAKGLQEKDGLDGVFTAGTDFSYTVAEVARALNLPGISPETAYAASDKVAMRRVFSRAGIASPDFVLITGEGDVRKKVSSLSFPLVVKPVDNMGARGVRRVDTPGDLRDAVAAARGNSHSGNIIVEEYIEGPEFSVDALVEKGEVSITGFADRIICFSPYFVEMGHTLPSQIEPSMRKKVETTFVEAIAALGIRDGAAKGDLKWNGRETVVGEIAARLSGGYMSGWTFPYATGIDLAGAALNISLGMPAGNLEPREEKVSAERAFISIPGIVEEIRGVEDVRHIPEVKDVFVVASPGDEVCFPTNNVQKCGNVIAVDKIREKACKAAEKGAQEVFVHLRSKERATGRYLFGGGEKRLREAFYLNIPENSHSLGEMELVRFFNDNKQVPEGDIHREKAAVPEIVVAPLPKLQVEDTTDWHGCTLTDSLKRVFELTGARFSRESEAGPSVELGLLFWKAFLGGGLQGGVWIIETVRKLVSDGDEIYAWWKRFSKEEEDVRE